MRPAAFILAGSSLQKSVIQSFQALLRSLAYSGSWASSVWRGRVRNMTATSMPSISMAWSWDAELKSWSLPTVNLWATWESMSGVLVA